MAVNGQRQAKNTVIEHVGIKITVVLGNHRDYRVSAPGQVTSKKRDTYTIGVRVDPRVRSLLTRKINPVSTTKHDTAITRFVEFAIIETGDSL